MNGNVISFYKLFFKIKKDHQTMTFKVMIKINKSSYFRVKLKRIKFGL